MNLSEENMGLLAIPKLKEPKTAEELREQIAILSDLVEKCERMLQHLAIGNFSASAQEIDYWMSKHIEVISLRNGLYKKLSAAEAANQVNRDSTTSYQPVSPAWWQFWK